MDERRILTVMFCDLVGSTALSAALDPEDLREVVRLYQEVGSAAIESVGGQVAQYLGDGLLAYFGWPLVAEDDASRAVTAGLRILQGLGELNQRVEAQYRFSLRARVGIQTGEAVVGETGRGMAQGTLAFGATPNIAARIQSIADPNTIFVGDMTASLIGDAFDLEERGCFEIHGARHPMRVARVLCERNHQRRFRVSESRGLTAMVARYDERYRLQTAWRHARR